MDSTRCLGGTSKLVGPNIDCKNMEHIILTYQKYHYQTAGNPNFKFVVEVSFDDGGT